MNKIPAGKAFYIPLSESRVAMYEAERIAETKGMGILETVGQAALEIGKVAIPAVIQTVAGGVGGYFGAKAGVGAATPALTQAVAAGTEQAISQTRKTYGYYDPNTQSFTPAKRRTKKKKKVKRRTYRRKKPALIDKETLNTMLMLKMFKD